MKARLLLSSTLGLVFLGALATYDPAFAVPVDCLGNSCQVSDNGASISTDDSEQDLDSFVVGGVDHLSEREFHIDFGVNSAGNPVTDNDISDELTIDSATQDEDTNQIVIVFSDSSVRVTLTYTLVGGGAASASVQYVAVVQNLTDGQLDLTLVDYIDFDLADSSGGDTVRFDGVNSIVQQDGDVTGIARSVSPFAHFDVGRCCEDELYNRLVGGHLSDNAGPDGPEDEVGAFQNNISLGDSAALTISRVLEINRQSGRARAPLLSVAGLLAAIGFLCTVGCLTLSRRRWNPQGLHAEK